jgi:hypothetical protein
MSVPAPFYNAIKGTTSGTPGTGAYTPSAAPTGYRSWANVPAGWIGLVRYEDGSAWELAFSYWNGTTLSRASTQVYDSSTGSQLTLTSSATAAMVIDASEIMSHVGGVPWRGWFPVINSATPTAVGIAAPTTTGTGAATTPAATNYLTEQSRTQITSATTANAQAGLSTATAAALVSTSAGHGGFEFVCRFGASQLPTGPRLFVGMTNATFVAVTAEPSASRTAANACFAKDSTDTNIQLLVNDNSASASTKTDTGIALTANGWYEAAIWVEPGATKVNALLIRLDTGAIWFGTTTTDVPPNGSLMFPQVIGGLSGTTGTAMILHVGAVTVRSGQ